MFNQEEINNLLAAGISIEEAQALRAKTIFEWENLKRLWDGRPLLPVPKYRSIDDPGIDYGLDSVCDSVCDLGDFHYD